MEDHGNSEDIHAKLMRLLEVMTDWEKRPTNVPGVKIMKIPAKNEIPARLSVELNPVDQSGKHIKKKGAIVLTNLELFEKYLELFTDPKIHELMREIEHLRQELQPELVEVPSHLMLEL